MSVRWTAHNLVGGLFVDDVNGSASDVEQSVCESSQTTLTITRTQAPANWKTVLSPLTAMVVCWADSFPIVGYFIRTTVGSPDRDQDLSLTLKSLEGLLEEVDVADADFDRVDSALVAKALAEQQLKPSWGVVVEATPSGTLVDRSYDSSDRQKLSDAFTDLRNEGDLEWSFRLRVVDDGENRNVVKVLSIGARVGGDTDQVLDSAALTYAPVPTVDCSDGRLAIRVRCVSTEGDESAWHVDGASLANGVPPWSTTVEVTVPDAVEDPVAYLDAVADKLLLVKARGLRTWDVAMSAGHPAALLPGRNFVAGDGIRVDALGGDGLLRLSGWKATVTGGRLDVVTPTVYDDREEAAV